jgi:hypothetical protein
VRSLAPLFRGERVGVRSSIREYRMRGVSPSPEIRYANFDLSPQATASGAR